MTVGASPLSMLMLTGITGSSVGLAKWTLVQQPCPPMSEGKTWAAHALESAYQTVAAGARVKRSQKSSYP
ncbi:hypothetical protein CP982_19175 [Streptomyces spectabilis]|uniref:Uncharacterized protein n=1 Tax=Streptomyces spectabilis TaxID=68270 RepID=A0A5P2X6F9_STRST|nr:hypothetical protein CP982_19175 [Streptomyces spectabilis]